MVPCLLRHLLACLSSLWLPAALAQPCPPPPAMPSAAQLQAAAAHDRGLLWRLERDGHTSYLYGTLHVGKPQWMVPGPRVAAALAASNVLALEIDPTDAAAQAELAADAGTVPTLPPAMKDRLARQMAAACIPVGALEGLHPVMQAMVLSMMDTRWVGLEAAFAQERALAQRAHATGQRIVSLESIALQKAVLVPKDTKTALATIDESLALLESGSGRSASVQLARAWEDGDLATLERYADWCDCMHNDDDRAAMRALNDERNPGLAAGVDALHREGRTVFAAVGALHMTGPLALPRLLAARGFTVERVAFGPP